MSKLRPDIVPQPPELPYSQIPAHITGLAVAAIFINQDAAKQALRMFCSRPLVSEGPQPMLYSPQNHGRFAVKLPLERLLMPFAKSTGSVPAPPVKARATCRLLGTGSIPGQCRKTCQFGKPSRAAFVAAIRDPTRSPSFAEPGPVTT